MPLATTWPLSNNCRLRVSPASGLKKACTQIWPLPAVFVVTPAVNCLLEPLKTTARLEMGAACRAAESAPRARPVQTAIFLLDDDFHMRVSSPLGRLQPFAGDGLVVQVQGL